MISRFALVAAAALFLSLPAKADEVIDKVWSGHHVGFALLSAGDRLYVGYYDAKRQLTIAERERGGGDWSYRKLDTRVGWDSHNGVALAVDDRGRLHVAANMHASPLTYYMSAPGGDLSTLKRVPTLVDAATERKVTYPVFLHDPNGRLVFKYRLGSSGKGNEIYDVFDSRAGRWSHLLSTPLIDGQGKYSAYTEGPTLGPDHRYHLAWVWRDTPDAATNHDLSYAESPDLVHWYTSDGRPLQLPITRATAQIVDPVPAHGGMLNGNTAIGFDDEGRTMITYHKFDPGGNTQVYVARDEDGRWNIRQISHWTHFRWNFGGTGAFTSQLSVRGAEPEPGGLVRIPVTREHQGVDFLVRASDLATVGETDPRSKRGDIAARYGVPERMGLNLEGDENCGCAIAWASRPANRDRAYKTQTAPTALVLLPEGK